MQFAASDAAHPPLPWHDATKRLEQDPRWGRRWRTVGGVSRTWVVLGALLRWIA